MGRETWAPIPGCAPFEASSLGRIRNRATGRIRRPALTGGYEALRLTNQSDPARVHALVAAAFLGLRPVGLVINHVDGDKRNNRPENLEYVTQRENLAHAIRTGLSRSIAEREHVVHRGEDHCRAKLTAEVVASARTRYVDEYATMDDLAREYGVSAASMRNAIRGKTWAHIPGAYAGPLNKRHRKSAS